MTTESGPGPEPVPDSVRQIHEVGGAMLRGGLYPAVVLGVLAVVVAGVVAGGTGVVAAAIGAAMAVVVCALGPLVMRWTARTEPLLVMGIAMISFVSKIGILAILFLVFDRLGIVDTRVLALALGATAIAFIAGETVAFARARIPTLAA